MEEIRRQVRRARLRMFWEQLMHTLIWSLLVTFSVAFLAILSRKIWPLGVDGRAWQTGWMVAATGIGIVFGLIWTCLRARNMLDAAIEIDRRCQLKERVSSAISISPDQMHSEAGQALLADTQRQLSRIDIKEHFRQTFTWHAGLPLLAASAVFFVALLVPDASREMAAASANNEPSKRRVSKSIAELKKRLVTPKKNKPSNRSEEADPIFTELKEAVDELSLQVPNRKRALVKLNNLTKEIAARSQSLEASRRLRDQLRQLQKIQSGPADRMASALNNADMKQAIQELDQLQSQLNSGNLSDQETQDLAKQLEQLRDQIAQRLAFKRGLEKKQRDLEKKMAELQQNGNTDAAARLQKQLEQTQQQLADLNRQDSQLAQLDQLAEQLNDSAESIKNGDPPAASSKLNQMAKSLARMQSELETLEALDAMKMEIDAAKQAMNCQACDGAGCAKCQPNSRLAGDRRSGSGDGSGTGQGQLEGPRDEAETDGYRTQVSAQPRPGKAIRVGDAKGDNLAGQSRQTVQNEIAGSYSQEPDPLMHQRLPRRERDQTKDYFERLRQGK